MDGRTQGKLLSLALSEARLGPDDLWIEYYAFGGDATEFELEAYLNGAIVLPAYERDLLADACNALLSQTTLSMRVPLSRENEPGCAAKDSRKAMGAAGAFLLTQEEAEEERLDAVARTGQLDTPPEDRFDRLTRQMTEYFDVSTAIITLVDDHRVFLKSVIGPLEQNIPRPVSFCDRTLKCPGALVVPNAGTDEHFRANPLVLGPPSIRFYAGYPVRGPGRWTVGTVCAIDQHPRDFSATDHQFLKQIVTVVEKELMV